MTEAPKRMSAERLAEIKTIYHYPPNGRDPCTGDELLDHIASLEAELEAARATALEEAAKHRQRNHMPKVARIVFDAATEFLALKPVFRLRPVGGPGSDARLRQDDLIAAEDRLRGSLKAMEATAYD